MSTIDNGSPPGPGLPDRRWWRPAIPNDVQRARYSDQLQLIIDGLNDDLRVRRGPSASVTVYPDPRDLAVTDFLYRTDTILTRTEADARRVAEALEIEVDLTGPDSRLPERVSWLWVIPLPVDRRWTEAGEELTPAESALVHVGQTLGPEVAAFDRVIHLTSNSGCPATEPIPASGGPDPSVNADAGLGQGVRIAVIDSGWPNEKGRLVEFPPGHWLAGVSGEPELAGLVGDPEREARLGHYRGHGMFVAGVIRAMAPAAEVYVHSWGPTTYGQIESELAPILERVLHPPSPQLDPHIISMSAGSGTSPRSAVSSESVEPVRASAAAQQPALSFEAFKDRLNETCTLLVCAAGNDGNQGPFVPASSNWSGPCDPPLKVAVGALKKRGRLAKYSNRGMWVDVYARGSKIVNAYPNGVYHYEEAPLRGTATFRHRLAEWSGTSFSTPLVAGLIAARMSWSGQLPRHAWASLRRIAHARAPYGLPTLRPGDADRGVEPAT